MLMTLHEPRQAPPGSPRLVPFALGFRPFYWLAGVFACLAVPLWMVIYFTGTPHPGALAGLPWHAHEMVFGFGLAVIAGFLLTAVRAWTGLATPTGAPLAALAAGWLAARLALFAGPLWLAAVFDLAWLAGLIVALARTLRRAGNRRNYFVPVLLLLFWLLNAAFYASAAGWPAAAARIPSPLTPVLAALLLVLLLITVIGGRVIPMFTQNATGAAVPRHVWLDRAAVVALVGVIASVACAAPPPLLATLCFAAAALHWLRLWLWRPGLTWHKPILWILHVSYAWIPVGIALLGLSALGRFPVPLAWHALAIGAMGGMIVGMTTRTARGHTGRPLRVGTLEIAAYALVHAAGLARVFLPAALPAHTALWTGAAACLWTAAFICYLTVHTPVLWRARIDGKPG